MANFLDLMLNKFEKRMSDVRETKNKCSRDDSYYEYWAGKEQAYYEVVEEIKIHFKATRYGYKG